MLEEEVEIVESRRILVLKPVEQLLLDDPQLVSSILEHLPQIYDLSSVREVLVDGLEEIESRQFRRGAHVEVVRG